MSGSEALPVTPGEKHDLVMPGSPDSDDQSETTTPLDEHISGNPIETKRVPSLRSISDPQNIHPSSTAIGMLGMARKPPTPASSFASSAGAMDNSVMAKVRALHQQRMQKGSPSASSPTTPVSQNIPGAINGFPGVPVHRPPPPNHPNSAPIIPKQSLSERRANKLGGGMKLPDMGGPSPSMRRPGAPKLGSLPGANGRSETAAGSRLDDYKKYIDTDKGWITFDGAATITREGVNFHNGQTFSISLDEVEILDELGKGNYGTVYKAKHSKPRVPRFGQGLSGVKPPIHHSVSDPIPLQKHEDDGKSTTTTGVTMAMKEIRLELDDAKFTTILKELVILHECVSPYIIDFYGAFFQEGAVYMCIEYMDGGSIDKLYPGGIPEGVLRKITYSTVMGLKALKDDHNIIHRDVKPTNILVNTQGQVKICDFGVSGNLVASIAKTNIGCQSYMAPERISGGGMAQVGNADGTYSVQSDIWSLGLTIIECAMGRYPYPPEVSSSIYSQLNAIVEGEPPGLPEEGYSPIAKDFVRSCLNKIPKLRPTYAMLLKHAWLSPMTKPQTITEEAEEGDEADKVAETVGQIELDASVEDEEVANWVKAVLKQQAVSGKGSPVAPALHAAPLDTVSPTASPLSGRNPLA
ncbi:unnamed protein product [Clonostachys rhizophaga]|uniref:mitogen-activated protein kinase kinase n=1 Tax=Clonostachys rhizophaga TaxID=160324 RepID=A0A9N9YFC6_9HYPO|nr:unnamed protein product [Clonostachys rhizophaga]